MENNFWSSVFGLSSGKFDKFMENLSKQQNQMWGEKGTVWIDTNKPFELYLEIPELRTVINKRALMMSGAVPKLVDMDGNNVDDHQWVFDLISKPNPTQSWSDCMYMIAVNDGLYNNSFAYCPKRSFDIRNLLVPLPTPKIKINLSGKFLDQMDAGGLIDGFEFWYDDKKNEKIALDDMLYFNTPDGINLINTENRIQTLKYPLSNIKAQYHKRNVLLENMSALGILSSRQSDMGGALPMDPEEKKEIQSDWIKRNKDQLVITEADVNWTPMAFPTKDLMLFEELTEDKMAIIDAFGLSYYLFSQSKGGTFSNVKEGMRMTYQDTIIPETEQMYATLSHQLGLVDQGLLIVPDFSHIAVLQDDESAKATALNTRADALNKIMLAGIELNDDEKRALLMM
tara:strand:- start:895 stop:2091 length:1197 start_codon:yes stop_codon:yes gene_type:complete